MFDPLEIRQWEEDIQQRQQVFLGSSSSNRLVSPRDKKKWEHHKSSHRRMGKESKAMRKIAQRRFRQRIKREDRVRGEDALPLVPHDYKTYGWLTW